MKTPPDLRKWLAQWRIRLQNTSMPHLFHGLIIQFWAGMNSIPEIQALLDRISNWKDANEGTTIASSLHIKVVGTVQLQDDFVLPATQRDHVRMSFEIIRHAQSAAAFVDKQDSYESQAGMWIDRKSNIQNLVQNRLRDQWNHRLSMYLQIIVDPLLNQLESELDTKSAVLAMLKRYKSKVELFDKAELAARIANNTSKGERIAKLHLFEYLHGNTLVYFVEPKIGEDEPDLVALQDTDDPLIAEGKVYSTDKRSIKEGFHQVYKYTQRYHAPIGYLVVYNTQSRPIEIQGDGAEANVQYIRLPSNVMIYFLIIDICPNQKSASNLGRHNPIIFECQEITTAALALENESDKLNTR